jgi:hypothetical protein
VNVDADVVEHCPEESGDGGVGEFVDFDALIRARGEMRDRQRINLSDLAQRTHDALADIVGRNCPGGTFEQENKNEIQISILLYCVSQPKPSQEINKYHPISKRPRSFLPHIHTRDFHA